jgi:hypothetical protein
MKFLKLSLIFALFLMGLFSIYKLDFLNRTMLITKVNQFDACRSSRLQQNSKYLAQNNGKHIFHYSNISHGRDGVRNGSRGRLMQNGNKWRMRFDFRAGMVNVMHYIFILALVVMIVYWADQKIRQQSN